MSKSDLYQKLDKRDEITLSVKGRKSGVYIARPVWFVYEGNTLYLLPVQGSETNWYKNLLADPALKISVDTLERTLRGRPVTDRKRVDEIVRKF